MKSVAKNIIIYKDPLEATKEEVLTIDTEKVLIEIMQDQEPEVAIESMKGDCFKDGYDSGVFVNKYGALFWGLVGGYTGGLVGGYMGSSFGWWVVRSILASSNPQPPDLEVNVLDSDCKNEYKKGFKDAAINARKSSVTSGCLIGLLFIVFTQ